MNLKTFRHTLMYVHHTDIIIRINHHILLNSFFGRFGASFNQSWTQQLDTTKKELAYGVVTNSSGNVYVAGMTYGESEENSPS